MALSFTITSRVVALEKAGEVVDRRLDASDRLEAVQQVIDEELRWAVAQAKRGGADRRALQDTILKLAGEVRQQLGPIETLAEIKNPPTLFAQQTNVAHGPQQVNNAVSTLDSPEARPTRAANRKNRTKRTIGAS